jgi:hypothetical protein
MGPTADMKDMMPEPDDRGPAGALNELLGLLPPEARRALRGVAEDTAHAARRAGGGANPLASLAAAAGRALAEPPTPPRTATPSAAPSAACAPSPATAGFARLPQPGTDWHLFVRRDAVVAVASPSAERAVVLLADGREVEVGASSDAVAREVPGLVRLTQAGTQRCLYVRAGSVLAVTAPAQGSVLHLAGGRDLPAGESAAVVAGLLAG